MGMSATEGIGRRNSMVSRESRAPTRLAPIARPSGTAIRVAIAMARAHESSVSSTGSHSSLVVTSSAKAARLSLTGGNVDRGSTPIRGATSKAANTTATPTTGSTKASARCRARPGERALTVCAIVPPRSPPARSHPAGRSRRTEGGAQLVGDTDHRALGHVGVAVDDVLHFGRADALAARDDDILQPVDDRD